MTTPERHDPPATTICLDEFATDLAVCVCKLPAGHDPWHECMCGATWHEIRVEATRDR